MKLMFSRITHKLDHRSIRTYRRKAFAVVLLGVLVLGSYQIWGFISPSQTEAAWWDDAWHYRKVIQVTYSGSQNLTEYQVLVDGLDTASMVSATKLQTDCDDLRFTSSAGVLLDYFIVGASCNTSDTEIWVKTNSIPASNINIYMYYGNPTAVAAQDEIATFSYQTERTVGYLLSDAASGTINVISLHDNNSISHNSTTVSLDFAAVDTSSITASQFGTVTAKGLFNIDDGEDTDTVNPISWAGTEFIGATSAGTDEFQVISPWGTATVRVYDNGTEDAGCGSPFTVTSSGSNLACDITDNDVFRITSDIPILVYYDEDGNQATRIVYPATDTDPLYGYSSGESRTAAGPNGADYRYMDDEDVSETNPADITASNYIAIVETNHWNDTSGPYRIRGATASDDIGVISFSDGGGNDMTTFVPRREFGTVFGSANDTDWIASLSDQSTTCKSINSSGTVVETKTLTSGNTSVYGHPNADDFGTGSNSTTYLAAGWYFECDKPAYAYWNNDNGTAGDEYNSWSWPMMRQFTYPTPSVGSPSTEEQAPSPNLWLKFDEAVDNTCSGGTNDTCDSSGRNNDGLNSAAVWQTEDMCVIGNCLYFDGVDDSVTISNNQTIDFDSDLNDGISVSFWVRPITDGEGTNGGEIIDKGSHLYCRVDSEGADGFADLECNIDLGTTDGTVNVTNGLTLGRWHHVVATYADDSDDDLLVYIDGQLVGTGNGSGAPVGTDTSNILIGGDTSNNYHGFIDEFKIYPYKRSANEVKTDYIIGAAKSGSSVSVGNDVYSFMSDGLVGYWKMDELTADSCNVSDDNCDYSGFDNDGAWQGDATVTAGKYASSVSLVDSTGDYVSMGTLAGRVSLPITISAWVKGSTGSNAWASNDAAIETYFSNVRLDISSTGGAPRARVDQTDSTAISSGTQSGYLDDTWYHYTLVVPSGTDNPFLWYINGELYEAVSPNPGFGWYFNASEVLNIGSSANSFNGEVDEVRYYGKYLDPAEIRNLYSTGPYPAGYWPMDENTGTPTTIYDKSTNGNNGTTAGTMTSADWVDGKLGSALDFDGSNDLIDANDVALTDIGDGRNFSVSFWMNRSTYTTDDTVIAKKNDQLNSSAGWVIWVDDTTDDVRLVVSDGDSTNLHTVDSTKTFTASGWNHVAVVYDDSSSTASKIYINGVDDSATNTTTGTFTSIGDLANAVDLRIASESDGGVPFAGLLDDVKFYNYARSSSQIIEDLNGSNPVVSSPIGSPVVHWKFDEGFGTTANDSMPQNGSENLTLSASTNWTSSGKYDKAYNGADNKRAATASDDDDLDFAAGTDLSFSLWFKSDSSTNPGASEYQYILNKGPTLAASAIGYAVYSDSSGFICFGIDDDTSSFPEDSVCSTTDLYDANWHHLLAVKTGNSKIELYIDGNRGGTPDTTISSTGTLANAATFYLGDGNATDGTDEFLGDIDDVKIYRAALTADQARVDYNAGSVTNFGTGTNERLLVEPSPTPIDYANNLVGYWPLDENTGTSTTYDKSVSGYDLTLSSIAEGDWSPGKNGSGIDFDGTSDYATAASENGNYSINSYTVSAWIYRQSDSAGIEAIVDNRDADNDGWTLFVNASDKFSCSYNSTDSASATSISLNTWYHISCTSNGSLQTLYLNGILEDSDAITGSISETTDVRIATQSYGTSQKFSGIIDEVRVFSSALSQGQISYEHNRGGPVGWWKLDECLGDTLYNSSGNSTYNGLRSGTGALNTASGTCGSGISTQAWNNGEVGRFGASLDFDADDDGTGGDDVVTVTNGNTIDFNVGLQNGVTLSAWIYANSDGEANTGNIINKGTNTYCRVDNQASSSLDLECQLDLTTTDRNVNISGGVTTDTWTHVAMSWSNDSDDDISVWINGVLRGTSTTNTNDTVPADTNNFYIGNNSSGTLTFDGKIDDVRLYNYALSSDQIKQVYTGGAVRFE